MQYFLPGQMFAMNINPAGLLLFMATSSIN